MFGCFFWSTFGSHLDRGPKSLKMYFWNGTMEVWSWKNTLWHQRSTSWSMMWIAFKYGIKIQFPFAYCDHDLSWVLFFGNIKCTFWLVMAPHTRYGGLLQWTPPTPSTFLAIGWDRELVHPINNCESRRNYMLFQVSKSELRCQSFKRSKWKSFSCMCFKNSHKVLLPNVLKTEPRTIFLFWITSWHMSFLMFVLNYKPGHIPLKYTRLH